MFPMSFPLRALRDAGPDDLVLDPFCGRGTTLFAARALGLRACGIDVNPVAVAIAQAKLASATADIVVQRARFLLDRTPDAVLPQGSFWDWAYHPSTLRQIATMRAALLTAKNDDSTKLLRALLLGVLHGPLRRGQPSYLSNQMPRTFATKPDSAVNYWQARNMRPPEVSLLEVLERRARFVLAQTPPPVQGRVDLQDARRLRRRREGFTRIVTSPPYPGMRSYLPDQWLRGWFLGGPPRPEYGSAGGFGMVGPGAFARELGQVWQRVAAVSDLGAVLTVRFGALPSVPCDPVSVLDESLRVSGAGWELATIEDTPPPPRRTRQAGQFGRPPGDFRSEVDATYVLAERRAR